MAVTVRQKRKGAGQSWHVFLHQGGKITSKAYATKRDADEAAADLRKKLRRGALTIDTPKPAGPTFGDGAAAYFRDHEHVLKNSTLDGYRKLYALHLEGKWAGTPMSRISREDVKEFLAAKRLEDSKRNKPLSVGSLRNIRNLISGIFSQAVEAGHVPHNPAQRLGRFIGKAPDHRSHIRALTEEQVGMVLAAARTSRPDYYPVLLCAFQTGMRLGEFLALSWEDIDFTQKIITVRRAWTHCRFTSPKTHRARRVAMSDALAAELGQHRIHLTKKRKGNLPAIQVPAGLAESEEVHLAFPGVSGRVLDPSWFRRNVWWPVLKKAGLPRARIHDIRHTVASLLLQKGYKPQIVMAQLGHSSIATTVDIYGHLTTDDTRDAVNALAAG